MYEVVGWEEEWEDMQEWSDMNKGGEIVSINRGKL